MLAAKKGGGGGKKGGNAKGGGGALAGLLKQKEQAAAAAAAEEAAALATPAQYQDPSLVFTLLDVCQSYWKSSGKWVDRPAPCCGRWRAGGGALQGRCSAQHARAALSQCTHVHSPSAPHYP